MSRSHLARADLLMIVLTAVGLLVSMAAHGIEAPVKTAVYVLSPLPTAAPSPAPTAGWWSDSQFLTPTLPSLAPLPGLPEVQLGTMPGTGMAAGQPVPFEVLACPTDWAKIAEIRTGKPGWWQLVGTALLPDLWYWKGEISTDGQGWTLLYKTERPVENGPLLDFLTRTVPKGSYQIRLMVVDHTGNYPEPCVVQVRV